MFLVHLSHPDGEEYDKNYDRLSHPPAEAQLDFGLMEAVKDGKYIDVHGTAKAQLLKGNVNTKQAFSPLLYEMTYRSVGTGNPISRNPLNNVLFVRRNFFLNF